MDKKRKIKEVINYLVFGVLTTLVNILSFYFLDSIIGWQYLWANALSIILSILFAYVTNKLFVFESKTESIQAIMREFISFISFRLLSGAIDMLSMWLLVDFIDIGTTGAKLLTQFIVVVLNYIFSKYFIFKSSTSVGNDSHK